LAAWLLATLVAVNGGAGLTMLSRIEIAHDGARVPALVFVFGVIFAILSGLASWWEAQDRSSLYYVESLREDQRSERAKREKSFWARRARCLRKTARWVNYASLASFLIGCALAALFAYD
jgi:antibiotic biosynthesis monooxygenase (ABM) superfamily enzyme